MNSSQEDLFGDQSKSVFYENSLEYGLEADQNEFQTTSHSHSVIFSSSQLSLDVKVFMTEEIYSRKFLFEFEIEGHPKTTHLEVTACRDTVFPPSFSAILLSTKLRLPTSNEYPAKVEFIERLAGVTESAVIIFGTVNGIVFALSTEKELGPRRLFQFPSASPILDFAVLYHIPCTKAAPGNENVKCCLVSVTANGLMAAYYITKSQPQINFYNLPKPGDSDRHHHLVCTPHGSWLHLVDTDAGSLLSLFFSRESFDNLGLNCTPAVFPQIPRFVPPAPSSEEDLSKKMKIDWTGLQVSIGRSLAELTKAMTWRPLGIEKLVRLPVCQMAAVNRDTGEELHLIDYLAKYEQKYSSPRSVDEPELSRLRSQVAFQGLRESVVRRVFSHSVTSELSKLLRTTVQIKPLCDLPGHLGDCREDSPDSVAVVVEISLPVPAEDWHTGSAITDCADFGGLSFPNLVHLLLHSDDAGPSGSLNRLRDCLSVLVEVAPLSHSSITTYCQAEKWQASSLLSSGATRRIICRPPLHVFANGGAETRVYLELAHDPSLSSILPVPLTQLLHQHRTTLLDFLQLQPRKQATKKGWFYLPVRVPRSEVLMPKFRDLFKKKGFLDTDATTVMSFRHMAMPTREVDIEVEIMSKGDLRLSASSLPVVWQLYEAVQHWISEFLRDDAGHEDVSVNDLREEYAKMEALELQLSTKNGRSDDVQALLDVYIFLRNCKTARLVDALSAANK